MGERRVTPGTSGWACRRRAARPGRARGPRAPARARVVRERRMNPFNLSGPAFLLFYIVFGAGLVAAVRWVRKSEESRGDPPPPAPRATSKSPSCAAARPGCTWPFVALVRSATGCALRDGGEPVGHGAAARLDDHRARPPQSGCPDAAKTTALFADTTLARTATRSTGEPRSWSGSACCRTRRSNKPAGTGSSWCWCGLLLAVAATKSRCRADGAMSSYWCWKLRCSC